MATTAKANNLAQTKMGSSIKLMLVITTRPSRARKRIFDGIKLSSSGLLAALMNNLHYPLGIRISGLLALHQPHKQLLVLAL
jgi:hypothetical protein